MPYIDRFTKSDNQFTLLLNVESSTTTTTTSTPSVLNISATNIAPNTPCNVTIELGSLSQKFSTVFTKEGRLAHNLYLFLESNDPITYVILFCSFVHFLFHLLSSSITIDFESSVSPTKIGVDLLTSSRTTTAFQSEIVSKLPSSYTPTAQHQGPLGPLLLETSYSIDFS